MDGDGVIVCGHTRWKAATKLGLEKVPVHVATDLTPEQIRAYRIADNKLTESRTNLSFPSLPSGSSELFFYLKPGFKQFLEPDLVIRMWCLITRQLLTYFVFAGTELLQLTLHALKILRG